MKNRIKIAIVGVGNCAKSLLEGLEFYTHNRAATAGLMHATIGGYRVADIEVVAAFDIDRRKVGRSVARAASSPPNRTWLISTIADGPVLVSRGPTHDGLTDELAREFIEESDAAAVDVSEVLRGAHADVVVNYLPTGSSLAARAYAEAALRAGCSFVNCMPTALAADRELANAFSRKDLVLLGDDIKSQLGATVLNRTLLELCRARGLKIRASHQLNLGGNADHFNLQYRGADKERSKEGALSSVLRADDAAPVVTMTYVKDQFDHKVAKISIEAEGFGGAPISVKVVLHDEDSPNSAAVVVDAIRAAQTLVDQGRVDDAPRISAYLMKASPSQLSEQESRREFESLLCERTGVRATGSVTR